MIKNDIEKILIDEQQLSEIIDRLAAEITRDYKDSPRKLIFVVILKGSIPFATELMKRVTLPLEIEVMKVSSYGA
ncbi:MAG: hypoxanthine phosphoribosyltransferase, partial [Clostridia bacterium]|nr:hypoxanthine phosphoribosyltransferase [Clostridia bacterium]